MLGRVDDEMIFSQSSLYAELLLGAARHRGRGRAGRANADRQFCITYPASAPVVQVTQQGSGGSVWRGGEGERNADAACSRTVSASATLPSPLPASQIGRDSLFHIERGSLRRQMPARKSSHLMQRDCYHSDAVSNCSVYFLPRGRKFTRPKIVGPRISKEERPRGREGRGLSIHPCSEEQ